MAMCSELACPGLPEEEEALLALLQPAQAAHKVTRPSKSIWMSNCPDWFTTAQKHLCWHQSQGQTKLLLQSLRQPGATMDLQHAPGLGRSPQGLVRASFPPSLSVLPVF